MSTSAQPSDATGHTLAASGSPPSVSPVLNQSVDSPSALPTPISNHTPIRKRLIATGVARPFQDRSTRHEAHAREAEGLSTMLSPDDFFTRCLNSEGPENVPTVQFRDLDQTTRREGSFATFVNASDIFEHHSFKNTNGMFGKKVQQADVSLSADFGIFDSPQGVQPKDPGHTKKVFRHLVAFGDIKGGESEDPMIFMERKKKGPLDDDGERDFRTDTSDGRLARGQFLAYAREIFASGHRTACFAFVILPHYKARLIRFDNSGIIFTNRFEYNTTPHLGRLFWILEHGSRELLGFDTSVQSLSPISPLVARAKSILVANETSLPHSITPRHFFKADCDTFFLFPVWDSVKKVVHRVIASEPYFSSPDFIGRSTRGYLGVDLDESGGQVCFLKDSWRISVRGIHQESETYRLLEKNGVTQYLPGFYFGGDVPIVAPEVDLIHSDCTTLHFVLPEPDEASSFQHSLTYEIVDSDLSIGRVFSDKSEKPIDDVEMYPHVHHRQLFSKIGAPLESFQSTRQLCNVLYHCVICHDQAFTAGILHRDISGGNILIDKDGDAILTDWELCRYTTDQEARRYGRTGTWQYLSLDLGLATPGHVQGRRDDLESILHILFYHVLRYTPLAHWDRDNLKFMFLLAFEESHIVEGRDKVVFPRLQYMQGKLFDDDELNDYVQPIALAGLMAKLRHVFQPIYSKPPTSDNMFVPLDRTGITSSGDTGALPPANHKERHEARKRARIDALNASSDVVKRVFEDWLPAAETEVEITRWLPDFAAKDYFPLGQAGSTTSKKHKRVVQGTGSRTRPSIHTPLFLSPHEEGEEGHS